VTTFGSPTSWRTCQQTGAALPSSQGAPPFPPSPPAHTALSLRVWWPVAPALGCPPPFWTLVINNRHARLLPTGATKKSAPSAPGRSHHLPDTDYAAVLNDSAGGGERPGTHTGLRPRSHCRFVRLLIHSVPYSPTYLVLRFLKRQCDRTPGTNRPRPQRGAATLAGAAGSCVVNCPGPPGAVARPQRSAQCTHVNYSNSEPSLYGGFVWARRALSSCLWRFPARAFMTMISSIGLVG
jgi:hypothetical protein